jgi:hypothetical protein
LHDIHRLGAVYHEWGEEGKVPSYSRELQPDDVRFLSWEQQWVEQGRLSCLFHGPHNRATIGVRDRVTVFGALPERGERGSSLA